MQSDITQAEILCKYEKIITNHSYLHEEVNNQFKLGECMFFEDHKLKVRTRRQLGDHVSLLIFP
jgi:hypothetical protein